MWEFPKNFYPADAAMYEKAGSTFENKREYVLSIIHNLNVCFSTERQRKRFRMKNEICRKLKHDTLLILFDWQRKNINRISFAYKAWEKYIYLNEIRKICCFPMNESKKKGFSRSFLRDGCFKRFHQILILHSFVFVYFNSWLTS